MKAAFLFATAALATAAPEESLSLDATEALGRYKDVRVAYFGSRRDRENPYGFAYFTPSGGVGFSIGNLQNLDEIANVTGCATGGLAYHIHDAWDNIPGSSATGGTACGKANTQNHYDPGMACGKASNNPECESQGGCVPGSTAAGDQGYICSPTTYQENVYVCEVGDLSNKFGKAVVGPHDSTFGYYQEPFFPSTYYDALKGKSVVFHCNSGARAFCAQIK